MLQIGLDLAYKTVGIAGIDDNRLIYTSIEISGKKYQKFSILEFQNEIVTLIWKYLLEQRWLEMEHILYIEDVFSGVNPKASINTARVQGAIIDRYMKYTKLCPKLIMAVTARKNVGINPRWNKAQIQMYIVEKFKLGEVSQDVCGEIISLPLQYERKKDILKLQLKTAGKGRIKLIKDELKQLKRDYNNSMGRLSTDIKKQTNINEHIADAIVLAMQNNVI